MKKITSSISSDFDPMAQKSYLLLLFLGCHGSPCGYHTLIVWPGLIKWPGLIEGPGLTE